LVTITGVFSEQKSQTKSLVAQGGGTIQDFDMFALDYDSDRHFFLSQYFRNKYDASLKIIHLLIVEFNYKTGNLGDQQTKRVNTSE
jgi:cell surface protein SprA